MARRAGSHPERRVTDMASKKTAAKKTKKKPDAAELSRDSDIEKVRVEKEVPVSMNREEGDRLSHQLADTVVKIKAIEDEIAQFASDRRKKLRELRKDEQRLASAVQTGKVMRPLECWLVKDYRTNTLRYVDDSNASVAPDEAMPAEMRQRELFDAPPGGERLDVDDEEGDAEE